MKKSATREDRFEVPEFKETVWTSSSKNIGEYLFRRISLDQSNKKLQDVRPRHMMSQLIISTKEMNTYVNDYLILMEKRSKTTPTKLAAEKINFDSYSHIQNQIKSVPVI